MQINVELNLKSDEKKQLAAILGAKESDLETALAPYAKTALLEYIRMFLGQRVFIRGTDLREYRLLLLIQEAFNNEIPDEQKISNLFQTSATQSRSLLKSVESKYQYELKNAIDSSLINIIQSAKQSEEDGDFEVTIRSMNAVEGLNRRLSLIDGGLPRVWRKPGTVSTYYIKPSSHEELCKFFNIKTK
jgi:hypothetical protein